MSIESCKAHPKLTDTAGGSPTAGRSPTRTGIPHVHTQVLTTFPPTAGFPAGRSALAQSSTHDLKVSSPQPSSLITPDAGSFIPSPSMSWLFCACPTLDRERHRVHLHSSGGFMGSKAFPNKCRLRRVALGSDGKLNPIALSKYQLHKIDNQC